MLMPRSELNIPLPPSPATLPASNPPTTTLNSPVVHPNPALPTPQNAEVGGEVPPRRTNKAAQPTPTILEQGKQSGLNVLQPASVTTPPTLNRSTSLDQPASLFQPVATIQPLSPIQSPSPIQPPSAMQPPSPIQLPSTLVPTPPTIPTILTGPVMPTQQTNTTVQPTIRPSKRKRAQEPALATSLYVNVDRNTADIAALRTDMSAVRAQLDRIVELLERSPARSGSESEDDDSRMEE